MPDWLHPIAELNTHLAVLGVAITVSDPVSGQLHCGVIYKYEGVPNTSFLHLEFHARLRLDSSFNSPEYMWVALQIDELRLPAIMVLCERIWKRRSSIPYGVLYAGGKFTQDGMLDLSSGGNGLTCATFVMAVFRNAGIELIEWWTWPSRPEDAEWHQWIVSVLQQFAQRRPTEISQDHINHIIQEIGCARFRPEEVTGACSNMDLPASFDFAVAAGEKILQELHS